VQHAIRVLIGARSAAERAWVAKLLSAGEGIAVVGTCSGARAVGLALRDLYPAVLVYSLDASETPEAVEAALSAKAVPPAVFLVDPHRMAVLASISASWAPRTFGDPFRSYLPTSVGEGELRAAVVATAAGLVVFHPSLAAGPGIEPAEVRGRGSGSRGGWGLDEVGDPDPITPREHEVLLMIAEGLPNKAIAAELGITSHTVKFHIASIMQKLDAASRTEAVTVGLRRGIILL